LPTPILVTKKLRGGNGAFGATGATADAAGAATGAGASAANADDRFNNNAEIINGLFFMFSLNM
jgi:hypothetical protein